MKFQTYNLSSNWSKKGSITNKNPFCYLFVYTVSGAKLLFKGGYKDVKSKMLSVVNEPCVVHVTHFRHGKPRSYINSLNFPSSTKVYFMRRERKNTLVVYKDKELVFSKTFKRFLNLGGNIA